MVRILLELSRDGLLRRFQASGHAGGAEAGRNIPCAAATFLLRTAGRLCAEHGVVESGGRGESGEMRLVLSPATSAHDEWLRGVTDFLVRGMSDLVREYPREITLRVEVMEV